MIHQILIALSTGHLGDTLPNNLLHPGEQSLVDKLVHLGHLYTLITQKTDLVSQRFFAKQAGLYSYALLTPIQSILNEYMNTVVDLERKILTANDIDTPGQLISLSQISLSFEKVIPLAHLSSISCSLKSTRCSNPSQPTMEIYSNY
jgi:hypothetical protein